MLYRSHFVIKAYCNMTPRSCYFMNYKIYELSVINHRTVSTICILYNVDV